MVRIVETAFKKQNSSVNEMVQHGISLYKGFAMENKALETFEGGRISWINELMSKCGVISSRAARTATHADRDRCEEARIPVP